MKQDIFIRRFLNKELSSIFISDIVIKRKASFITIFVYLAKNSLVFKDDFILKLNKKVSDILSSVFSLNLFSFNIVEVNESDFSSSFFADSIKQQLEKRVPFRKVIKNAISKVQLSKPNIKGIKVQVSGRLNGAEIARTEWIREGQMPLHTLRSNIDYSKSEARLIFLEKMLRII